MHNGGLQRSVRSVVLAAALVALVVCGVGSLPGLASAERPRGSAWQSAHDPGAPSSQLELATNAVPAAPPFSRTIAAGPPVRSSTTTLDPPPGVLGEPPTIAALPLPSAPPPESTPTPSPSAAPQGDAALRVRVQAVLADYSAVERQAAGVVIEVAGAEAVALNGDQAFATASLYKLFVLWGVQRAIASGDLTADTLLTFLAEDDDSAEDGALTWAIGDQISVAELCAAMITASNNSAAWVLARTIGWQEIDQVLLANGFSHSRAADGVSTPREIARFFDRLLAHTLDPRLRATDYDTMLALLLAQEVNSYLSPGFPSQAVFAHKTGNLPGVINDAGILYLPDGRTVTIVVMTEGDEGASFAVLRAIAAAVWAYYTEP